MVEPPGTTSVNHISAASGNLEASVRSRHEGDHAAGGRRDLIEPAVFMLGRVDAVSDGVR